jgi:hypothetical protein
MPLLLSTPRERREAKRDLDLTRDVLSAAVDASLVFQDEVDRLLDALAERTAQLDAMNDAVIEALKLFESAKRAYDLLHREIAIEGVDHFEVGLRHR